MSPFPVLREDPHACALGEAVLIEHIPGWPQLWGVDFRLDESPTAAVFRLEAIPGGDRALVWRRVR